MLTSTKPNSLQLTINKNDFLLLNNNWIGLKSKELPCFLNRKIPHKWLNSKNAYSLSDNNTKYLIEEKIVIFTLTF